jgi:CspA family cold shock protein
MNGIVKWFKEDKGYGFISPDAGGKDIFVHASEVKRANIRALEAGDRISFDAQPSKNGKGDQAVNLRLI